MIHIAHILLRAQDTINLRHPRLLPQSRLHKRATTLMGGQRERITAASSVAFKAMEMMCLWEGATSLFKRTLENSRILLNVKIFRRMRKRKFLLLVYAAWRLLCQQVF